MERRVERARETTCESVAKEGEEEAKERGGRGWWVCGRKTSVDVMDG